MLAISYASVAGTAGVAAELASLLLILVSFIVIVYTARKIKTRKSFQFEILIFSVVLIAAEIPRTLYSLGVLDIDALSPVGLGIHSVSMVILTAFVAVRTYGFFRGKAMVSAPTDVDSAILIAAGDSLSKTLGETTTKALAFYLPERLLLDDPWQYDVALKRFLGEGAGVLEKTIIDRICAERGIDRTTVETLDEVVEKARGKRAT